MISRVSGTKVVHRPTPPVRLDLAECYRYCEAVVRSHHENFPVASRFLPERLRPHVSALYAFARWATVTDPQILRIVFSASRSKSRYDAGKRGANSRQQVTARG